MSDFKFCILCLTAVIISAISHSENKCLTGHDIDAKIQQSFLTQPLDQPTTKERKTP